MKLFGSIVACALAFVLGTLMPIRDTQAQTTAPTSTFYQISFHKSRPGQDWRKVEHELWKPVHTERMNSGHLNSWTVIEPEFAGPHPYDYITIESFNNLDDFTKTDYGQIFAKVWGKENIESRITQTTNARDEIGNEIWQVDESISKPAK